MLLCVTPSRFSATKLSFLTHDDGITSSTSVSCSSPPPLKKLAPTNHLLYKAKQILIRTNKIEITVLRTARIRFEVAALPIL